MTRHDARRSAFALLFQKSFTDSTLEDILENSDAEITPLDDFSVQLLTLCFSNLSDIDAAIVPHLNRWTIERLPRVSLAVLRLSCAQLLFMPELPVSVIINESVELTKEFGGEDEFSFVNGALRNIAAASRPGEA